MSQFSTPRCTCLYELEHKLPRTKHCFVACSAQFEILEAREKKTKLSLPKKRIFNNKKKTK